MRNFEDKIQMHSTKSEDRKIVLSKQEVKLKAN